MKLHCKCLGCGSMLPGQLLCRRCEKTISRGRAILCEVTNDSAPPEGTCTGYRVVIDPSIYKGDLSPGLYAVRQTDMQQFMKALYKIKIDGTNRNSTVLESRTTTSSRYFVRISGETPKELPASLVAGKRVRRDGKNLHDLTRNQLATGHKPRSADRHVSTHPQGGKGAAQKRVK